LRILGLRIQVVYVDFWPAYPTAIKAIYPDAVIQYDFFHVMQNIHRHLYKALTAYRKAFKGAKTEQDQDKVRKALHTKLWQNRYSCPKRAFGNYRQQTTLACAIAAFLRAYGRSWSGGGAR